MKRTVALLGAALLAASFAPKPADAAARCAGVHPQSIFGTVATVRSDGFTLRTRSGNTNVYMPPTDPDVRSVAGATLRPGVYAGVFGCLPPGSNTFFAEEITVSSSEETYPGDARFETERIIYGRVDRVEQGRLLVHSAKTRDAWVMTDQTGFAVGQTVEVSGHWIPNGAFDARHVTVVR